MKIYDNSVEIEKGKIILSNSEFELAKNIIKNNDNTILITPLTKIKEVLSFNKDSGLEKLTMEILEENDLLNIDLSISIINKINQLLNEEYIELNEDKNKLLKLIFELNENYITIKNLSQILNIIGKYFVKIPQIIFMGFNEEIICDLNFLQITNPSKSFVNYKNIGKLILNENNDILEIHDIDAFISWLELKTKSVITENDLTNYFNGTVCYSSYAIESALKTLKNLI